MNCFLLLDFPVFTFFVVPYSTAFPLVVTWRDDQGKARKCEVEIRVSSGWIFLYIFAYFTSFTFHCSVLCHGHLERRGR